MRLGYLRINTATSFWLDSACDVYVVKIWYTIRISFSRNIHTSIMFDSSPFRYSTIMSSESNLNLARKAISIFVDQRQVDAQKELEERETIVRESLRQLEEAKQIVPALFAKPGDQFVYRGTRLNTNTMLDYGLTYLEYIGRNETPRVQLDYLTHMYSKQYDTPEIGWLVFRWMSGERIDAGLRGACGAWPKECFQYYNEEGTAVQDTICIPPTMCGILWKHSEQIRNE